MPELTGKEKYKDIQRAFETKYELKSMDTKKMREIEVVD